MKYLLYFVVIGLFVSCDKESPEVKILQGNAFGTSYSIQYFMDNTINIERGVDSVVHAVNQSVSTYLPNSDISKINRGDSILQIDKIFKDVIHISEGVFNNSNGYFDPTIGVLRNAYGFGDTKPIEKMNRHILDSLMQFVGFEKVYISTKGNVIKEHPEIYLDFNAVAKGYGIDCIGRYLESISVTNYLIELGGEILTKGKNLNKNKTWVVGIENVDSQIGDRSFSAIVKLQDQAMASSGNYRKFRIDSVTGLKYVHTINPLNGSAEKSDITSATIIAPNCALADAYATACMAMGLERSLEMLQSLPNIRAYLTYLDSSDEAQVYIGTNFEKQLLKKYDSLSF